MEGSYFRNQTLGIVLQCSQTCEDGIHGGTGSKRANFCHIYSVRHCSHFCGSKDRACSRALGWWSPGIWEMLLLCFRELHGWKPLERSIFSYLCPPRGVFCAQTFQGQRVVVAPEEQQHTFTWDWWNSETLKVFSNLKSVIPRLF